MNSRRIAVPLLVSALLFAVPASTAPPERVDLVTMTKIRDEALNRSKVMDTLSEICDGIGPRLTGSPSMKKANLWAKKRLEEWGLANVHLETWGPFGRGWWYGRTSVRMVSPTGAQIPAIPKAWTPGTDGVKSGKVVRAKLESEEDLAKWKGKLAGAIVLSEDPPVLKPHEKPDAERHTAQSLEELTQFEPGADRGRRGPFDRDKARKRFEFQKSLLKFLEEEKVLAVLSASERGDDGTVFVQGGGNYKKDQPVGCTALAVPAEAYGRLARLVDRKEDVRLELDVEAAFTDEDPDAAANVIAEIPGADKKLKDEVVMLGAHFDSWHGGTGATDNGAGSGVVMETMRILKAIGLAPRRTVRMALWTGEEQGLLGSRAYVSRHFASRPEPSDPAERDLPSYLRARPNAGPIEFKPDHAKLAAYFNLDNGTGKVRGVYCQENLAVGPIFREWLVPFEDLGANTITMRKTGGTDHQSFDGVGLPGFQFIQDELDYDSRTHHSNMDTYERLQKSDLMQASALMAAFVTDAAMRDDKLPRKPLPPEPEKREEKPAKILNPPAVVEREGAAAPAVGTSR